MFKRHFLIAALLLLSLLCSGCIEIPVAYMLTGAFSSGYMLRKKIEPIAEDLKELFNLRRNAKGQNTKNGCQHSEGACLDENTNSADNKTNELELLKGKDRKPKVRILNLGKRARPLGPSSMLRSPEINYFKSKPETLVIKKKKNSLHYLTNKTLRPWSLFS